MARTRQTARRSTGGRAPRRQLATRAAIRAPRKSKFKASASTAKKDGQLLRLTVQQVLEPAFVFEQTRDIVSVPKHDADDEEEVATPGSLVATAMGESRTQHLTAGLRARPGVEMGAADGDHLQGSEEVLHRLGRELAALGVSADASFQTLAEKRTIVLDSVFSAYESEFRARHMASARRHQKDNIHPIIKIGVQSGVFIMLSLLKDAAVNNHSLCLQILDYLTAQIAQVGPMVFSQDEPSGRMDLPAPELTGQAFDAVHDALFSVAVSNQTPSSIKTRCLELLVSVAVSRGSLSILLSVLKLLLFEVEGKDLVNVRQTLHVLRSVRHRVYMDLPSEKSEDVRISFSDSEHQATGHHTSIATDGSYIYVHSSMGLMKIGTGANGTSPGYVYAHIRGYRAKETSSMVCVGDKLYYRSPAVVPAAMIVISTRYLQEIGDIRIDGSGDFKTADLSGTKGALGLARLSDMGLGEDKPEVLMLSNKITQLRAELTRIEDGYDDSDSEDEYRDDYS